MNYELADNAKYLYCLWLVLWVGIYVINAIIYKDYQEKQQFSYYDEDEAPDARLLFTLWWKIENKETTETTRLKKAVNKLSVCFGTLTILVIVVVVFLWSCVVA